MENKYTEQDVKSFLRHFRTFPNQIQEIDAHNIFLGVYYYIFMEEYDEFLKKIFYTLSHNSGVYSDIYEAIMYFLFETPLEDIPLYINKENINVKEIPKIYNVFIEKSYQDRYINLHKEYIIEIFNRLVLWRLEIGK